MGRAIGRQFDDVVETGVSNSTRLETWLAVEIAAETGASIYGLYFSADTDTPGSADILNRLHFVRYTMLRGARLVDAGLNQSLQAQILRHAARKIWEKTCYRDDSGDVVHEFETPFRLPANSEGYTFAVDFGWSNLGLANSNLLRFCVRGEHG